MKTKPHLMLEVIWKDNRTSFTNSTIVPDMMEKGEIIGLTGDYNFYPLEVMEEAVDNIMYNEHGIDLKKIK
jgi:hypothetical protein